MSKYMDRARELRAIVTPHYNCAQAVLLPFAPDAGVSEEQAYKLAANFGAGMKLGLAGGPLVVAILMGAFGYRFGINTYTSTGANLMLREVGLLLFLSSVGIQAGAKFWDTICAGGYHYVWQGFLITVIPILIMGVIARKLLKLNYFTLMGLIAGSNTDPPALAFANQTAGNDAPAVGYSTVYPLAMFLRIHSRWRSFCSSVQQSFFAVDFQV